MHMHGRVFFCGQQSSLNDLAGQTLSQQERREKTLHESRASLKLKTGNFQTLAYLKKRGFGETEGSVLFVAWRTRYFLPRSPRLPNDSGYDRSTT